MKMKNRYDEPPVVDKVAFKGWWTWTGGGRPARPLAQYEDANKGPRPSTWFCWYLEDREHRLGQKPARWGRGRSTAARRRRAKRTQR